MDSEDLIAGALEPGERIVWCDHPHRLRGAWRAFADVRRKTLLDLAGYLFSFWLLCGLTPAIGAALVTNATRRAHEARSLFATGWHFALALFSLVYLALLGGELMRIVSRRNDRYAVTDRGRVLVASGGVLRTSELPTPAAITTDARGSQEFGDIVLGAVGPVFYAVSYPLIAVESIRSVAARPGACPDTA